MNKELIKELLAETTIEDITETKRPIAEITGIEVFAELGEYAKGQELYFPNLDNILAPARNRRIRKEYNGYNEKALAQAYGLTIKQIIYILRDVPHPEQMNIFDIITK